MAISQCLVFVKKIAFICFLQVATISNKQTKMGYDVEHEIKLLQQEITRLHNDGEGSGTDADGHLIVCVRACDVGDCLMPVVGQIWSHLQ